MLEEIGVLDTLLVKAKVPPQARHTTLKFYAGEGDHEAIHDVFMSICRVQVRARILTISPATYGTYGRKLWRDQVSAYLSEQHSYIY